MILRRLGVAFRREFAEILTRARARARAGTRTRDETADVCPIATAERRL